jgi:chemotaxis regulatin CheY-phosphate phosphatase CheZ
MRKDSNSLLADDFLVMRRIVKNLRQAAHLLREPTGADASGPKHRPRTLRQVRSLLSAARVDCAELRRNLQEVLMIQDYRDFTGQIIRRVIQLTAQLERELAHIVQTTEEEGAREAAGDEEANMARGPGSAVLRIRWEARCAQASVEEFLQLNFSEPAKLT